MSPTGLEGPAPPAMQAIKLNMKPSYFHLQTSLKEGNMLA